MMIAANAGQDSCAAIQAFAIYPAMQLPPLPKREKLAARPGATFSFEPAAALTTAH
jgi:hypothetical protein